MARTASTAVATQDPAGVPALIQPRMDIDASDIALPRIYIGQGLSHAVTEGLAKIGDIYTALSKDDPDVDVLWSIGQDDGVRLHVLGMTKGKTLSANGEMDSWEFNDPNAPAEAWTTYKYTVALPEVDDQLPFKFLLTRTGAPTAKQINLQIMKHEATGPCSALAFELSSVKRTNDKGTFAVARARVVKADPKHVAAAAELAAMIAAPQQNPADRNATGEEPAI